MTKKEKSELQKEIISSVKKGESGRFLLSPRSGKTKMIIDIIKRDKPEGKILWVTPTAKLAKEDIPAEFIKWRAKKYLKQLETCTWKSLSKYTGDYSLIILDEEQFITENNAKTLLSKKLKAEVLLSMTGTESKYDSKKDLYRRLKLKVLYKLSINTAVDVGLLSNYSINVVMIDMDKKNNIQVNYKDKKTKKQVTFMTSEYKQYKSVERKIDSGKGNKFSVLFRMRLIHNSPAKLGAAKYIINSLSGKKLIFAANTTIAEELSDFTYHSKTDNSDLDAFISGRTNKIAMVNKGGTGYTYTDVDNLVVTQVDSDQNGLTSQKIARTLLKQGKYEATIWLLCLKETKDEDWLASTLSSFNKDKITVMEFKDLKV